MKTPRTRSLPPFFTQVIGSLPRPKLLLDLLARRKDMPADRYAKVMDDMIVFAIRLQEQAGLDVVSDGEWRRTHYVGEFLARAADGSASPADNLLTQREAVLIELRDLDFDHETGKVGYRVNGQFRRPRTRDCTSSCGAIRPKCQPGMRCSPNWRNQNRKRKCDLWRPAAEGVTYSASGATCRGAELVAVCETFSPIVTRRNNIQNKSSPKYGTANRSGNSLAAVSIRRLTNDWSVLLRRTDLAWPTEIRLYGRP